MVDPDVGRKGCSSAYSTEQLHSSQDQSTTKHEKKLRMACDNCHSSKIRCCGGMPCNSCNRIQVECVRSTSRRKGRPKGARNKKITNKEATNSNNCQDDAENSALYCLSYDNDQNSIETAKDTTSCNDANQSLPPDLLANASVFSPFYDPISFTDYFLSESPKNSDVANTAACSAALYGTHDMLMDCSDITFQSVEERQADMENSKQGQTQEKGKERSNLKHLDELDVYGGNIGSEILAEFSSRAISQWLPCNCLQWFARILASLKALAREEPSLQRMESVLACTQDAICAWKQLLQCDQCRENNAEEVLYLSISGIRIALHNLDTNFSPNEIDGDSAVISEADGGLNSCPGDNSGSATNQTMNTNWQFNSLRNGSLTSLDKLPPSQSLGAAGGSSAASSTSTAPSMSLKKTCPWWMSSQHLDFEQQQIVGRIVAMRMIRAIQEVLQTLGERRRSLRALSSSSLSELSFEVSNTDTISGGLHSVDASQQLAMTFGDSSMHLQHLLDSTIKASDMLVLRLRSMSIQQLKKL